jgi:hypothetical protein
MELKLIFKWKKTLAISLSVESAGNEAWDVQQNTKASIENYSKDGLSILIRLLQMWQVMKAEWNIQGLYFVDGNLRRRFMG